MDNKIFVVAKREYLERVRTRWFVIVTLVVPILISGMFLVPAYLARRGGPSANTRNIVILDATAAGLGDRVAKELTPDSTGAGALGVKPIVRVVTPTQLPAAEQEATQAVMQKNGRVGYLVLNDSTLAGKLARYAGRNTTQFADLDRIRTAVRQGVLMTRLRAAGVNAVTMDSLGRMSLTMSTERISERGRGGSAESGFLVGFSIAFMLYLSIILHGQNVLRGVLEEKTTRVAEVVISSVKPDVLLAGKVIGVAAVGLTQQAVWIGASAYIMQTFAPLIAPGGAAASGANAAANASMSNAFGGLSIPIFLAILAFFLVGFVFYASLYAAVGSMVNSEQEAQQAAVPVTFIFVGAFVLLQPVMLNPSGPLAVVLSWLPISSPIMMPVRMTIASVSPLEVIGSWIVALLGCAAVIWLAARIYRVGLLMYGKKPTMRELVRWVRAAY